jgi:hypothetical protein
VLTISVQLAQLEKELREQSKETQKDKESEAPIINPGFGGPLLITHNGLVFPLSIFIWLTFIGQFCGTSAANNEWVRYGNGSSEYESTIVG